jgi:hypothetical protein
MYVKIGSFPTWWGPYQIAELLMFWVKKYENEEDDERVHRFGRWLAEDRHGNDSWLTKICQWVHKNFQNNGEQRVTVRIDRYDTWSMDHTLARIVAPMLRQLRATKHGAPQVDNKDVPKELRMSKREQLVFDNAHWDESLNASEEECDAASKKFFARWDWILDEMIWAWEQLEQGNWESQYHSGNHDITWTKVDAAGNPVDDSYQGETLHRMDLGPNNTHRFDKEGHKRHAERMQRGFMLFGKYLQNLWD